MIVELEHCQRDPAIGFNYGYFSNCKISSVANCQNTKLATTIFNVVQSFRYMV